MVGEGVRGWNGDLYPGDVGGGAVKMSRDFIHKITLAYLDAKYGRTTIRELMGLTDRGYPPLPGHLPPPAYPKSKLWRAVLSMKGAKE